MKKSLLAVAALALGAMTANAATVYFDNTDTGWDAVYAYSWSPDYTAALSTTEIDGHTLYFAELPNEKIIFRGAPDWNHGQTEDLLVIDGRVYGKSNIKHGSTVPEANIVNGQYVPNSGGEDPTPEEYNVYLAGEVNGWAGNSEEYKFTSTDGKNFTYSIASLPGEFKLVVNGSWLGNTDDSIVLFETYVLSDTGFGGNCKLLDQEASDLTLNFNVETNEMKITGTPGGGDVSGFVTVQFENGGNTNDMVYQGNGIWEYEGEVAQDMILLWIDGSMYGIEEEITEANTPVNVLPYQFNGSALEPAVYTVVFNETAMTLSLNKDVEPVVPEVYLSGEVNEWAPNSEAYKFTSTDGKNFTYSIASLPGEFKLVVNGNWLGTTDDSIVLFETYVLSDTGFGGNCKLLDQEASDLTLNFNIETNEMKITGTPGGGDVSGFVTVQFENGGNTNDMVYQGNGIWEYEGEVAQDMILLWIDGSMYGIEEEITAANTPVNVLPYQFNGSALEPAVYTVVFNETAMTLSLNKEVEPAAAEVYLAGEVNNWLSGQANYQFTTTDNKIYTYEIPYLPGEFKIVVDGAWLGTLETIELDTPYVLSDTGVGGNCKLADQNAAGLTLTFNAETSTLTITDGNEVEEVVTYQLRGTIFNGEWENRDMTEANGEWNWEGNVIPGTFGIRKLTNGIQLPDGGWISAADNETEINGDGNYQGTDFGGDNWNSSIQGFTSITFNPETMVLSFSGTVGVMEINMENGNVIYFDLQGNRIAEPANGLFIRVENGKATKVIK